MRNTCWRHLHLHRIEIPRRSHRRSPKNHRKEPRTMNPTTQTKSPPTAIKLRPQTHQILKEADQQEQPRSKTNHRSTLPKNNRLRSIQEQPTWSLKSRVDWAKREQKHRSETGKSRRKMMLSEPPLSGEESRRTDAGGATDPRNPKLATTV